MSEFSFPESERIDFAEIHDANAYNQHLLEAKYLGDVTQFRAEIIQRMIGCNALQPVDSWMYFRDSSGNRSDMLVDSGDRHILITLTSSLGIPEAQPHIKIVTNTEFILDSVTAYLTEDVTVDSDADSQLLVDTVFIDANGYVMPSRTPGIATSSTLFWVGAGDNKLVRINPNQYTPVMSLYPFIKSGIDKALYPFGYFSVLEDKIAALDWAVGIIEDTKTAELVACSNGQ